MLPSNLHEAIWNARMASWENATDLSEELDRRGLLATPEHDRQIALDLLQIFETCIDGERAESIIRWFYGETKSCTPAEMWEAMRAWLLDFANRRREEITECPRHLPED